MSDKSGLLSRQQPYRLFFSYAFIGVLTNLFVYGFFLLLTYLWGRPS